MIRRPARLRHEVRHAIRLKHYSISHSCIHRLPNAGAAIDCRTPSHASARIADSPMTLIYLSTAWLIGIAAAHYLSPPLAVISLLAALPLAALILWREDAKVRRIAACGLFILLGSLRYTLSLPTCLVLTTSLPMLTRARSSCGAEWSESLM